jgi:hypothetical protein
LLLIYIALVISPPSAEHVTVVMSQSSQMTFTRNTDGWWSRPDDTGSTLYFKSEGTNLIIKTRFNQLETKDLSTYFDLTGNEEWAKTPVIRAKPPENGQVAIRVEKDRAIAKVIIGGTTEDATLKWDTSGK